MKKNILFYILAVVLFAASAFTACSNNDEQASGLPVNTYTITVNATKGDDASSAPSNRALAFDGSTLNVTWTQGDKVEVYKSDTELGKLTAQSSGASTTLTGTLTTSGIAVNDVLTLKYLSPDYASQTGTLDYIAAHCDYATATVTVSSISGNNITTTPASFANQQAIVKFTLMDTGGSSISATPLVVTANGTSYTVTPDPATNELYVAVPGFASKDVLLTATVGSNTYTYTKTGVTFENGKYYTINVKMALVKTLANATAEDVGKIVGTDGNIYAKGTDATTAGTIPAAMIAYISSTGHGLAIALTDDASASFTYAGTNAANHTPVVTGGTWQMPTKENWEKIFEGCGGTHDENWDISGLRTNLAAYSESLSKDIYWTGTTNGDYVYLVSIGTTTASFQSTYKTTTTSYKVRAVLAF